MDDAAGRIATLDILRGLALFGMIVVHFHQKFRLSTEDVPRYVGETWVGWVVWIGVEEKAWATFAFLFGAGFAVLLRRLEMRGQPVVALYLRRLAVLFLIGAALYATTGFVVLQEYALWGVALLFVRKWSTRWLLVIAVVAAAGWAIVPLATGLHAWVTLGREGADAAAQSGADRVMTAMPPAQTYLELVMRRLRAMPANYTQWGVLIPGSSFTLFIAGLLAVRHGVFDEPQRHVRLIVSAMVLGAVSFALAWGVLPYVPVGFAPAQVGVLFTFGLGIVSGQWLAFTYIGAVVLLLAFRERWLARLAWFGLAGRMALTNYVLQCVVIEFMASRFGLGLHLRPYYYLLGAVILFASQLLLASCWLSHFRYGPLEWVWRTLTYLRIERIRAQNRPAASAPQMS